MRFFGAAVAAFLMANAGLAAAAESDALRKAFTPLRQSTRESAQLGRDFIAARDSLAAWLESRIAAFPRGADAAAFTNTLNAEITAKDLSCAEAKAPGYNRCASPRQLAARGYVGLIDVAYVRDLLVVQAEVGVRCGFDETAYVYEWVKDGWRRLFDTAQPAAGPYVPEQIEQVQFSQPSKMPADALLFVATGVSPSCADQYRPVHYRVWSAKRGVGANLIVDGREGDAYTGRRTPAVSARFEGDGLLLEMDVRSLDSSRLSRVAVRRFGFDKAQAERLAPLALTPRDFVEEWLRAPWSAAQAWTDARAREALGEIHRAANSNLARARFSGPTQRCANDTRAVQVGVRFAGGERFFRLKYDPAGAYVMLAADSAPAAACAAADASLDTSHSLF